MIKKLFLLIFILIIGFTLPTKVDAYIPVTYSCCYNYTYSDGIQLNNFEYVPIGGFQLDNFENLSNWTIQEGDQRADLINFEEGTKGLKLITTNGNRAASDKVINNNFSTVNNFAIWLYIDNLTTFNYFRIYITSTGTAWNKYYMYSLYGGFKSGWNKLVIDKNDTGWTNINGENWNNIMNRIRIAIYPITGQNTNSTVDDLRYNVNNDWIVGGIEGSLEADIVNFKEGEQGLKLIALNGNSSYIDKIINNDFSTTNNFAIWVYVNNASDLDYIRIYFTSTGSTWNKFFYDSIYNMPNGGAKTGWNKLIFNKNNFKNDGGESWNNIMNRIRLRISPYPPWPFGSADVNITLDDLRYDMTGKRAKFIIDFDDAKTTTYSNAYPILSANNQSAVTFVITSNVGSTYYMNLDNLRTLQSAGWDISSHTVDHINLATSDSSVQTRELNDSYDWLVTNNFQKSAGFIAYPYGAFNDAVIEKVKKRYILGRSTIPESAQQHFSPIDPIRYIQRTINVENTTTVQSVKDQVNDSINAKLLGIMFFHDIVDSNPSRYEYLKTDFKAISDYLKSRSSDIDVITYSDYVIPNINSFTPIINKITRIYSNGSSVLITKNKYDEYMPNMTVKPLSDSIDINITTYNETGGLIKFNESSPNHNLQVSYTIGDRIPNQLYSVKIYWANGTKYQDFNVLTNSTGYINYNSAGFGDLRYQEIDSGNIADTTFTVTLPVGYTFLKFNASSSTVTNLDPDGQNSLNPTFNITNNGNIIQRFAFYLNGTITNIITYADLDNDHSTGRVEINTTPSIIIPNLNPGSSQNVWLVIDAIKAPAINSNKTLMINSS